MASRAAVQQENKDKGKVAVPVGIKKKNMAEERKTRPALTNIGNRLTIPVETKPVPKVSRPVTRSFYAKSLAANSQAVVVEKKKNALTIGAMPNKAKPLRKKEANKAIVKTKKPKEIIVISPDTEDIVKKDDSSKKKAPTLTSILTARSKVASSLSNKLNDPTVDIDATDADDDLAAVEYVEDIYKFYKSAENESLVNDYIDSQPEISKRVRAILIDWLIQVHLKFKLSPETFYLTINIVDRYLARKTTSRREVQLVGISATLIASKYEEIWAPQVNDLVCISDKAYSNEQVLVMEKQILGELEWSLTVPTLYVFLVRFIKASLTDSLVENMVYFLAEMGMMNYSTLIYCPSMIAASAVYAARRTLDRGPFWNATLKMHTGYTESQLMDCAKLLVSFHSMAADHNLKGIYVKYSSEERGGVALLPPAKFLSVA